LVFIAPYALDQKAPLVKAWSSVKECIVFSVTKSHWGTNTRSKKVQLSSYWYLGRSNDSALLIF